MDSAIEIAIQIAQGLAKAHAHGIIHRDLKPANVIVTNEGVARILDFGLAKLSGQPRLTKTGSTVGTMAYMSPEQARGEEVDNRTDILHVAKGAETLVHPRLPSTADKLLRNKKIKWGAATAGIALLLVWRPFGFKPRLFESEALAAPKPIAVISFENQTGDSTYNCESE